jgi:hypothetical protein
VNTVNFTYLDALYGTMQHESTLQLIWFVFIVFLKTFINMVSIMSKNGYKLDIVLQSVFVVFTVLLVKWQP